MLLLQFERTPEADTDEAVEAASNPSHYLKYF